MQYTIRIQSNVQGISNCIFLMIGKMFLNGLIKQINRPGRAHYEAILLGNNNEVIN